MESLPPGAEMTFLTFGFPPLTFFAWLDVRLAAGFDVGFILTRRFDLVSVFLLVMVSPFGLLFHPDSPMIAA